MNALAKKELSVIQSVSFVDPLNRLLTLNVLVLKDFTYPMINVSKLPNVQKMPHLKQFDNYAYAIKKMKQLLMISVRLAEQTSSSMVNNVNVRKDTGIMILIVLLFQLAMKINSLKSQNVIALSDTPKQTENALNAK